MALTKLTKLEIMVNYLYNKIRDFTTNILEPIDVKTAYEANLNTNAFTDFFKTKLESLQAYSDIVIVDDVSKLQTIVELGTDDYLEFFIENNTLINNITVSDFNLIIT